MPVRAMEAHHTHSYPSPPYGDDYSADISNKDDYYSKWGKKKSDLSNETCLEVNNYADSAPKKTKLSLHRNSYKSHNPARVYPNLTANFRADKAKPISADKHKKKPESCEQPKAYCNVCRQQVSEKAFPRHLFFGTIKCIDCGWVGSDCHSFLKKNRVVFQSNKLCNHINIKWQGNLVANFENWFRLKSCDKLFQQKFKNYLSLLRGLSEMEPWQKAFSICENFLRKPKTKPTLENLDLPKDDNYLVLKKPVEECPNCYTALSLSNFVFDLHLKLISTVCEYCKLKVYFVLPPPDGSTPTVKIC